MFAVVARLREFSPGQGLRGGFLSLVVQAQLVPLQLATAVLLARWLGPRQFGVYSFAMAVVALVQVMPNSGLDNVVVRYSSRYRVMADEGHLAGLWRFSGGLALLYGIAAAALLVALALSGVLRASAALAPRTLALAALPLLFLPSMTVYGAALRAVHPGVRGQLPQFMIRPWVYLILIVVLATVAPFGLSARSALCAQGAAAALAALTGLYWLRRARPIALCESSAKYEVARWVHALVPFSLLGGLMLINTQADILMLGLLGSAPATGLYRVASQGANLVSLALIAANLYIAPRIATLFSAGDMRILQRMLTASVRATFFLALLVAGIFWLAGRGLLSLVFGHAYLAAFAPLAILSVGQLINVGFGSVGQVLNMTGNEREAARMAGVAAVANVVLNAMLIPVYGGIGAATATVISTLMWNLFMMRSVRARTGLRTALF